jgi:hypothetical protein
MIRVNNARGVGALGATTVPACLPTVPKNYGLRQSYFAEPNGRYAPGSPGAAQVMSHMQLVDQHLRSACYNNDVGCGQTQEMYGYVLMMLANERYERNEDAEEMDEEVEYYDNRADEAMEALKDCQDALASGQGCPAPLPPPACPPPVVSQRRQQRQQQRQQQQQGGSKWGANLGWVAGGAVAGAALTFFIAKR